MVGRPLSGDSRLALAFLALEVIEDAGAALVDLCARSTRRGRMLRHLHNLQEAGLISHGGSGPLDQRLLRITEAGRLAFWGSVDPEALWRRRWDGVWRIALFDVPESQNALRTRMRRKLRELRFGWLQNSVWLSPDPVSELVRALKHERVSVESLLFIEGRPAGGETDAELVASAWDFPKLATLHATYLKFLKTRPAARRGIRDGEWPEWLAAEERAWREIVRYDPFLPAALLPRDYTGRAVWDARREALGSAARAFAEAPESAHG